MRSDFEEILFSVLIPALVILGIAILIMAAPSVDAIVFGK